METKERAAKIVANYLTLCAALVGYKAMWPETSDFNRRRLAAAIHGERYIMRKEINGVGVPQCLVTTWRDMDCDAILPQVRRIFAWSEHADYRTEEEIKDLMSFVEIKLEIWRESLVLLKRMRRGVFARLWYAVLNK